MPLARAQAKLARVHLRVKVQGGSQGKVVKQSLPAFTAALPGGEIVLTVKA